MERMMTHSWKPCEELAPYIERYWFWESGAAQALPVLLPGTGNDLFIHFKRPFASIRSPAHLLCVRSRPWPLEPDGPTAFVAIRFRMGALRHFCRFGIGDLFDQAVSVEQLWGKEGGRWVEQVEMEFRYPRAIVILESQLLRWLRKYRRMEAEIDRAATQLYYGHADCRVEDLVSSGRISRRQLERTFKSAMGLSPKAFQRLARFQQTVRDLLLVPSRGGLDTALAHGYYDQSHFIRDFESFAQVSPTAFLNRRNSMSHFYNPPGALSAIPACTFMRNGNNGRKGGGTP